MKQFIKILPIIVILIIFLQIETYAELDFDKLKKHDSYQDRVVGNTRYSNDDFSINIPNEYTQMIENSFGNEDGDNINIQITSFSGGYPYTQDVLNILVEEVYSQINDHRETIRENLKKQYGNYLSDSEIDSYVNSFKLNSIDKKEISTFTKNKYKCIHIIANFSMDDYNYFSNQYTVFSGNKTFILTISVNNKEKMETSEIENIINSFTINNYEEPTKIEDKSFISDDVVDKMIISALSVVIIGIISLIIDYFHRKNQKKLKNKYLFSEDDN